MLVRRQILVADYFMQYAFRLYIYTMHILFCWIIFTPFKWTDKIFIFNFQKLRIQFG